MSPRLDLLYLIMKGTPPFARHPVELESLTPQIAGLGDDLRKARVLWKEGSLKLLFTGRELWLLHSASGDLRAAVRLAQEDHGFDGIRVARRSDGVLATLRGKLGRYRVTVTAGEEGQRVSLRVVVTLEPHVPARLEGLSREVHLLDRGLEPLPEGLLFTTQTKASAGQAFVAVGATTVFYLQNLGALARYSSLTGASLLSTVGVEWPALGFKLPPGERPLPPGEEIVISDLFLRIRSGANDGEAGRAVEFLEGLAATYRKIAPAPGGWYDWAAMAGKTLKAIRRSPDCVRRIRRRCYLNAYVGSHDKPPESMVQGAIYVPLVEYELWNGKSQPLARELAGNLTEFRLEDLGTLARWLPGGKFLKDAPSDEEQHEKMDSWYLLHTLMNLGRLAELGKDTEKKLFLDSLGYTIRVAKHFDYDWPVFYNRKTLQVLRRETEDGAGGEQDAAGLYAHVMMQAWRVTRDRRYLDEAEMSAAKLEGLGFGVLYQTNNTTFTAVALAWLWKETGNILYKDLSVVCMASILSHLWMWEPARPGRRWRTFMGLPPLHDAPYIAAYEEAEIFAASRAYLEAMADEVPPALVELLVEYGKHLLGRARYYLPPELPADALCSQPKEGIMKETLPVPVEDLYPSSDPAGQVGQQVYGAALALILTTRSVHRWQKVPFMVFCEAPITGTEFELQVKKKRGEICFRVAGPALHRYSVRIIPRRRSGGALHSTVHREEGGKRRAKLKPTQTPEGHHTFDAAGTACITIAWKVH